jgi:hypothetical protein
MAHWSERQKLEAVTTYLMVGKWPVVSDATGIPIDTLKKWKQADWWEDLEREIRRSSNIEVGGKLKVIINKAASVVEDRLENGDLVYNPSTNSFTRKPIGAKIASEIMVKSIDRNILLEKLQEAPVLKEEAILDRLKNIENALIRASTKRKITNVIDVEVVPSVSLSHDSSDLPSDGVHSIPATGGRGSSDIGSGPELPSGVHVSGDRSTPE